MKIHSGIPYTHTITPTWLYSSYIVCMPQIEDDLLYRWIKDASDYDADLGRGGELWKLVARQKEVKNEAGEVTRPANEPTLRAKKSELYILFFRRRRTHAIGI